MARISVLLIVAVGHELVLVTNLATLTLHVGWRFNGMLNLAFASLLLFFLLDLKGKLAPLTEEASHVLHPVVCIEQGCHGVEQVFVTM